MRKFVLTLTFCSFAPVAALASDDTSGHSMSSHGKMNHGTMTHDAMGDHAAMEGIHAEATVNTMSDGTVNVTHGPIAEIGWPAMTMDLGVLDGAMIEGVAPGDEVMMMLEKGDDGMYAIRALMPKE